MRRIVLAAATAALLVLPLAACSSASGSDASGSPGSSSPAPSPVVSSGVWSSKSGWQKEYTHAIADQFAKVDSAQLKESCQTLATHKVDAPTQYVSYVKANGGQSLTLDSLLSSLQAEGSDAPSLATIVPDGATVDEVLALTGEVHLAACKSIGQ
jgi:hypothetical protein